MHNKKIKAVIIDDDISFSFLIGETLMNHDIDVVEYSDGSEFLAQISDLEPDLIVLDVMMPIINGFEVCQAIRKIPEFTHTPVLMMTGLDDEESIQKAFDVGATDFISKPFNFTLFSQRIKYLLRNGRVTDELGKSQHRLTLAQSIAKLSYWEWNAQTEQFLLSALLKETLQIQEVPANLSFSFLLANIPKDERQAVSDWYQSAIDGGNVAGITHGIMKPDGTTVYFNHQIRSEKDSYNKVVRLYGAMVDITDMHDAQAQITKLAYYDNLTALPNRFLFQEILNGQIKQSDRHSRKFALLYIDIDNFKRINDTLGHHFGDLLLMKFSDRILCCLRESDFLIRVQAHDKDNEIGLSRRGGDEFTLLLPEITGVESAAIVASRILQAVSKPFLIEENDILVSPSIGISIYPDDAQTADDLIKNSDIAMYYAKREGKNNFKYFNPDMQNEITARMQMESAMRKGIENKEFKLVYQPQIDLEEHTIHGVEALIRWHSADLGFVTPDRFIPLAEETGLIIPIGDWVLREACRQAKEWLDNGVRIDHVAVNVSTRQFSQTKFDETVARTLNETGLPPSMLEIEITESVLMKQADAGIAMLKKLKCLGVSLSIDDFGTGYSSLAYLKQFPIDHLKIDKTFIDDVNTDNGNASIVKAVISMASNMNLQVTAEGVETNEQLDFLKAFKCGKVQGYFFSKPILAEDVYEFVKEFSSPRHLKEKL
jgi:diguanylate cyclase (GGDEF)-like protein